jgi:hypothetical protein
MSVMNTYLPEGAVIFQKMTLQGSVYPVWQSHPTDFAQAKYAPSRVDPNGNAITA